MNISPFRRERSRFRDFSSVRLAQIVESKRSSGDVKNKVDALSASFIALRPEAPGPGIGISLAFSGMMLKLPPLPPPLAAAAMGGSKWFTWKGSLPSTHHADHRISPEESPNITFNRMGYSLLRRYNEQSLFGGQNDGKQPDEEQHLIAGAFFSSCSRGEEPHMVPT